jgi:HEXXH motif-containing protein
MIERPGFEPSAERARSLDGRMRGRLAESLHYILDQAEGYLTYSRPAFDAFLQRLAHGPVSAQVFGAYCDLVLDIESERLDLAQQLVAEILAAPNQPDGPHLIDFRDPAEDAACDRYGRLVDTDPSMPFRLLPPPAAVAAACRERIAAALALLDAGFPALAAELRVIVREIVLAVGPDEPGAVVFDGASSFMLWGAIVLNARTHKTTLEMAQALAHESGHNLLFGLCADGPLIENDDVERFASPLRLDPRPMDGIVHATYVTARMHQTLHRLLGSGVLDTMQQEEARAGLAENERAFASGIAIVDRHARFTPLGEAVMAGARDHMAAFGRAGCA